MVFNILYQNDTRRTSNAIEVKIFLLYPVCVFFKAISPGICSFIVSKFCTFSFLFPEYLTTWAENVFSSIDPSIHPSLNYHHLNNYITVTICGQGYNDKQHIILNFQEIRATTYTPIKVWFLRRQWSPEVMTNRFTYKRFKPSAWSDMGVSLVENRGI